MTEQIQVQFVRVGFYPALKHLRCVCSGHGLCGYVKGTVEGVVWWAQCVVWSAESHLNDCRLTCLPEACPHTSWLSHCSASWLEELLWSWWFQGNEEKEADEMVSCKWLLQRGLWEVYRTCKMCALSVFSVGLSGTLMLCLLMFVWERGNSWAPVGPSWCQPGFSSSCPPQGNQCKQGSSFL